MKVHAAVAKALAENGVRTVFGLIGDGNLYIIRSLVEDHGITYYAAVNETGSVSMADGFARVTRQLGVASVTHGPGLTNTVTPLIEAVKSRVPLLLIIGDTPAGDHQHIQNIDQRAIVEPTGAAFIEITSPDTVAADVAIAVRTAVGERRAVVLNVPLEMQWLDCEPALEPTVGYLPEPSPRVPSDSQLDRAVGIIASARRPIVIGGRGATDPTAKAAVLGLADLIGAPVASTLRAKDLFVHEKEANIGVFGSLSSQFAQDSIAAADCIIAFGCSLNRLTSFGGTLLDGKSVVHVDDDPLAVGRWSAVDAGVVGDVTLTATRMREWLTDAEIGDTGFRRSLEITPERSLTPYTDRTRPGTVDVRWAVRWLDSALPADRIGSFDGGRSFGDVVRNFHVSDARDAIWGGVGFGAVGTSAPAAVGAALAGTGRLVVNTIGDGGWMLSGLAEFNTAVRYGADLIVVVLNDGSYGAEYIQYRDKGLGVDLSLFDWPEFADVARSLGGEGVTLASEDDKEIVVKAIAERKGPLLIDVKLDPASMPDRNNPDV